MFLNLLIYLLIR